MCELEVQIANSGLSAARRRNCSFVLPNTRRRDPARICSSDESTDQKRDASIQHKAHGKRVRESLLRTSPWLFIRPTHDGRLTGHGVNQN
jgi:hypothetical protein